MYNVSSDDVIYSRYIYKDRNIKRIIMKIKQLVNAIEEYIIQDYGKFTESNLADLLLKLNINLVDIHKAMELVDREREEAIQEETWEREDYENNK